MRNGGLRRSAKPYPNAPDQHFPLIDSAVDKHKPFYVQQIYGTDVLASFVSRQQQDIEKTTAVAGWFDHQVKQASNFQREAISGIDKVLEGGGSPMKVFWNERCNRLEFDSCDPLHVIVPKSTEELPTADHLTHAIPMSVAQYKRNKAFRQDEDFIKAIKGKGTDDGTDTEKSDAVDLREGLTCGSTDDEIVVWEIYVRDPDDYKKILVKTRSPLKFEEPIRPDFQLPYKEGVFKEGWFPFVKWRREIKEKGYYASRGIAEIDAPFEAHMCRTWNTIAEHMDFHAKPMFEQDPNFPVAQNNVKTAPGSILPAGLKAAVSVAPPTFLREEMNMTREMAEYRLSAPDFGVMEQNGGRQTATATNAIVQQQGQGVDLNARIFRLDLADTYKMAWAILLQYGKESLSFIMQGEAQDVPADALHDDYEVAPNGSPETWNKNAVMQKAVARFQMFAGNPFIKQGPLVKSVLAADEAGLVKELYQEPQDAQAGEAEEQAMELSIIEMGFPASVDPTDDDKAHLITMVQYFAERQRTGEPIRPRTARLALRHGSEHTEALQQKKDPALKRLNQQLMPMIQMLGQIAQQPDPAEIAAMQKVVPMQQGRMPVAGSAAQVASPQPVPVAPTPPIPAAQ